MEYQDNEVVTISLERYEELKYEKNQVEEEFRDLLITVRNAFDFTQLEPGSYKATTDEGKLLKLASFVKDLDVSFWSIAKNEVKELVINTNTTNGGNK